MASIFYLFLVICLTAFSVMALDNCALKAAELLASGNTCIDLSLCPVAGGAPPICPFIYFPACGKLW